MPAPTSGQGAVPSTEQSAFAPAHSTARSPSHPASVVLPGPRSRRNGAGGFQRPEAHPGLLAWVARGRSTSAAALRASPAPATPSRAAVTAAASSRRQELADPAGVDGGPGSQSPPVCGPSAARLANTPALFAVNASHPADVRGAATSARATTTPPPSPALAAFGRGGGRAGAGGPSGGACSELGARERSGLSTRGEACERTSAPGGKREPRRRWREQGLLTARSRAPG